ncbi:TNT domain-containing protein [Aquimarina celericrescens]|uniref:Glycohydrolase toxin TNT-related protein n=1 Tax=Aquimarina celericrescens TaxID=1964542 RepID=A0ABW5AZD3_9FLAO|nr:glycohydrolase toxin TNT-related protein [Aquimarina celericrescens]
MGNLQSLTRNGWQNSSSYTNLDVLSYQYTASSNKLLSVTDSGNKTYGFKDRNISGNDYAYDINGNLIQDKNKGITSVSYNYFNFPTRIHVTNPDHDGNVQYIYDANGVKLKKTAIDRGTTNILEYNGNFVYENGSLKSITHPEGYIEQEDDGSFTYVYEHRDIWNNTRITYADNNKDGVVTAAEIRREQNYYPFGMSWQAVNSTIRNAKNNLKTFQGQELTEDLGLNTHEWRYRISDRSIGRFWQIDPLAEQYDYNSTFAFQENKMGMGVELEGAELWGWVQQQLVQNTAENPNGVSAHVMGAVQGVVENGEGLLEAVTNPVQTAKGMGDLAVALASQGNVSTMMQADEALGTNSMQAANAVVTSVEKGANDLVNGSGIDRGKVIGNVASALVGAKGVTAATKAISAAFKGSKTVSTTTALANYYPANKGAMGATTTTVLEIGTKIDRYGNLGGKYFSPTGTPLLNRALPNNASTSIYNSFEFTKSFSVEASTIAPTFGKVGTGTQYFSPTLNAQELLQGGFIKAN